MSKKRSIQKTKDEKEWPVVVYVWALGLFIAFWFIGGEAIMQSSPHPLHWVAGLVGGLLGIPLGWLWYRWRGDVI